MNIIAGLILFLFLFLIALFLGVWFFMSLSTALMAVAGALALGVLVVLFVWLRLRRALDKMAKPLMAALSGEFTLESKRRRNKRRKEETARLSRQLEGKGFVHTGFYKLKDQDFFLEGMANPAMSAYAVIYDAQYFEPWVDLVTPYRDGGSYCCTSAAKEMLVGPRKPDMILESLPGAGVQRLVAFLDEERPNREFDAVSVEAFKEFFEDHQRRNFEWIAEQSRETLALEEELRAEFLAKSGIAPERFEENAGNYFFVHDRLDPALVALRLGLVDAITSYEGDAAPMELVDEVVARGDAPFALAAELSAPAPAYVLVFPEEAEVDMFEAEIEDGEVEPI